MEENYLCRDLGDVKSLRLNPIPTVPPFHAQKDGFKRPIKNMEVIISLKTEHIEVEEE